MQASVIDLVQTEFEREVGRGGQRRAIPVNGPEPAFRARQKAQRRHDIELRRKIEAPEPRPDQPHVMIERQPADEDVGGVCLHGLADGANIGEQVGVAQHDTLGIAGTARGVLNERGRSLMRGRQPGGGRARRKPGHTLDRGQARHLCLQQGRGPSRFRNRYQDTGARTAQDGRLAAQVLLQLGHAHRRIDGHGDRAGIKDGKERNEEIAARWQHQGDPVARHNIPLDQALRGGACGPSEFAVSQRSKLPCAVVEQSQVAAVRMAAGVPFKDVHQGPRFDRGRNEGKRLRCGNRRKLSSARMRVFQCAKEIANRLRRPGHRSGKPHTERSLDP